MALCHRRALGSLTEPWGYEWIRRRAPPPGRSACQRRCRAGTSRQDPSSPGSSPCSTPRSARATRSGCGRCLRTTKQSPWRPV
eukprot:4548480-Lingulodinium_polyedra.AAC.1